MTETKRLIILLMSLGRIDSECSKFKRLVQPFIDYFYHESCDLYSIDLKQRDLVWIKSALTKFEVLSKDDENVLGLVVNAKLYMTNRENNNGKPKA